MAIGGGGSQAEFGLSVSTAERYMAVVDRFGTKFVTMTYLQPGTQYLLAAKATPKDIADQVVAELEAGNDLSNKAIRDRIATAKKEAKRSPKKEKVPPQQLEKRAHQGASEQRQEEEQDREHAEEEKNRNAASQAAARSW